MISAAQVPVTASAFPLVTVPPDAVVTLTVPTGTIYLGGAGVTASTGAPVTGVLPIANPAAGSAVTLYAIAASGTVATGVITVVPR